MQQGRRHCTVVYKLGDFASACDGTLGQVAGLLMVDLTIEAAQLLVLEGDLINSPTGIGQSRAYH